MIKKLTNRIRRLIGVMETQSKLDRLLIESRIASGFSRGSAMSALRTIDPSVPLSWEFGAFSQHSEDGILEYLINNLLSCDKYFLEIAAGDGLENCTAWLALAEKWSGVMVEGDYDLAEHCRRVYQNRIWNVVVKNCFVNSQNIEEILNAIPIRDFDVFSLDIDSIDYHILKATIDYGFTPKIIVLEYNSAFGPDNCITVPYKPAFNRWVEHPAGIYYGASLAAFRNLLEKKGYHFVTVESSGTNAFFANRRYFDPAFLASLDCLSFAENATDINKTTSTIGMDGKVSKLLKTNWTKQFEIIKDMDFQFIDS